MQEVLNYELKNKRFIKQMPTSTYMYNKLKIKGLLIECGFLSNSYEKKLLVKKNYQQKVAKAIASGVNKYFNS